jgi:outer membrane lipoprotein-sorting protein
MTLRRSNGLSAFSVRAAHGWGMADTPDTPCDTGSPQPAADPGGRSRVGRRKLVLVAAATAATLGAAGLAAMALPAGAGTRPSLPDIAAEQLLASALDARPPAMAGTVEVDNALGLPALPGLPSQLGNGDTRMRVWFDGDGRSRVALPGPSSERTVVYDGTTVWRWSSAGRTVTKVTHPATGRPDRTGLDPASVAGQLLDMIRPTSTVAVDGTAMVADRPAYELILAPAPTERTLLREVRVALDSQTRLPLRLRVLANGTDDPVFSVGFSQVTFGPQDASLFRFTPPAGATVTEQGPDEQAATGGPFGSREPVIVGDGWDTVLVAALPDGALSGAAPSRPGRPPVGGTGGAGLDPRSLLERIGTPVSGPWGSGHLVSTAVLSVVVTDDGRVAAGAVPQQVLLEALSR